VEEAVVDMAHKDHEMLFGSTLVYVQSVTPVLNWKEIAALVDAIRPEIEGLFVDRVVVPERPNFPEGYVRNEWVIRLTGRRSEAALFFSIRPRQPYLAFCQGKGPKASTKATQSPFSLNLSKQLKGARILSVEALPRERILVLWLTAEGANAHVEKLGLVFCLIPAVPEALLVRVEAKNPGSWKILSRSRTLSPEQARAASPDFNPPTGAQAPADPPLRAELFAGGPEAFHQVLERELAKEAFALRVHAAERELKDLIKQARERIRLSEKALGDAGREADWQRYGELLKAVLHDLPEPNSRGERIVVDFATEKEVAIPSDPKLGPREQVEKFFQLARRKARRAEEARLRIESFGENLRKWEKALAQPPLEGDWKGLERFEGLANIRPQNRAQAARTGGKGKVSSWLGKTFVSKEGLLILAGRSKDENLELTFKHARGNDVWLHVRGRPGAHVLVPLTGGKSAPLETLLDAATLAIYYSGGEKWGKTEVDYTYKKYVKRIKDSTEASYTHNKTLIVEPDPVRIKRLLGTAE
jgi:predicted ribosome quality control (RQC) complex YloA/Tae2 family protein